jgi:hypothetical protein
MRAEDEEGEREAEGDDEARETAMSAMPLLRFSITRERLSSMSVSASTGTTPSSRSSID